MADASAVADLLLARCATMAIGNPVLPIAFPDVAFNPPSGPYLRVNLFFNRPAWEGLSSGRFDQGLLQITVVCPKGRGVILPATFAKSVMGYFPKGLKLFGPGLRVSVSREPWMAAPIQGDASSETPITISWTAS